MRFRRLTTIVITVLAAVYFTGSYVTVLLLLVKRTQNAPTAALLRPPPLDTKDEAAAVSCPTTTNTDTVAPCSPQDVLVFIKSGASPRKYAQRRANWRNSACPKQYNDKGVSYTFVTGLPMRRQRLDPALKSYRIRENATEIEDFQLLQQERDTFHDILVLPHRDIYTELAMKTLQMTEKAVHIAEAEGKSMIVLHDDENCLSYEELQSVCKEGLASNSSIYAGNFLWGKPHAKGGAQIANDGKSFAKYFDGGLYVLSVDLARSIVDDEDTVLAYMYFPHLEDVIMGHWVKKQNDDPARGKRVSYVHKKSLMWVVQKGNR